MGVFNNSNDAAHLGSPDGGPYICMGCEAVFEVQYHSCPSCGGYDVRHSKWVGE